MGSNKTEQTNLRSVEPTKPNFKPRKCTLEKQLIFFIVFPQCFLFFIWCHKLCTQSIKTKDPSSRFIQALGFIVWGLFDSTAKRGQRLSFNQKECVCSINASCYNRGRKGRFEIYCLEPWKVWVGWHCWYVAVQTHLELCCTHQSPPHHFFWSNCCQS